MAPAAPRVCVPKSPEAAAKFGIAHSNGDSGVAKPLVKAATDVQELLDGLRSPTKTIPCSYLYDPKGTKLYNEITELQEYYPYRAELKMLREAAEDIITHIPYGSVLVELGCGSATKTALLQRALLARDGPQACSFVGIDVSADFLKQAKANLLEACPTLLPDRVELVQATYLDGLRIARERHPDDTLCVLWLGSSVGNMSPSESLAFFKDIIRISGHNTEVLVCTDLWKDASTLHAAYCDRQGVTEAFIKNGMANALYAVSGGKQRFCTDTWKYEVIINAELKQVEMHLTANESILLPGGIHIHSGERILIEVSRKFTSSHLRGLSFNAGFYFQAQWRSPQYSIQMLCAPSLAMQLAWRDTDRLFARVLDWGTNPIELRHPFCFYYGHLVSFAKLRLVKDDPAADWDTMFSRGMDPDVADPTQCHSRPATPPKWPSKQETIIYALKLRAKMRAVLERSDGVPPMHLVCLCLEHERLHHETLCYMLAQEQKQAWEAAHLLEDGQVVQNGSLVDESIAKWDSGILAPCEVGSSVSTKANGHSNNASNGFNGTGGSISAMANGHSTLALTGTEAWVNVPSGQIEQGIDTEGSCGFVWDNEGPLQAPLKVGGFQAGAVPVSIADFREFVLQPGAYDDPELWEADHLAVFKTSGQRCPATWTVTADKDVWVHYPEGTHHWSRVSERPVWCSLAEAKAFSKARGCRVMTEPEYNLALAYDPHGSRIEMLEAGGWEWTASKFEPFEGFVPLPDYEEYSHDFFDDKHFTLKGSSPYTHASLLRSSFRNWYQEVYPFMFAKFRCCR